MCGDTQDPRGHVVRPLVQPPPSESYPRNTSQSCYCYVVERERSEGKMYLLDALQQRTPPAVRCRLPRGWKVVPVVTFGVISQVCEYCVKRGPGFLKNIG